MDNVLIWFLFGFAIVSFVSGFKNMVENCESMRSYALMYFYGFIVCFCGLSAICSMDVKYDTMHDVIIWDTKYLCVDNTLIFQQADGNYMPVYTVSDNGLNPLSCENRKLSSLLKR